jgi:Uma2 family endonuclease
MPATALLTSEQYLALPDEFDKNGNHVKDELIGGEVVKVPPPPQLHNLVKINIIGALLQYERAQRKLAVKVLAEMAFIVTSHDTFVPDASVILKSRLNPRKHKYITGAPELAIEVVSPTDKATHLKSKVDPYLANGSNTVWVVFPDAKSVMVHTSGSVRELKADQKIEDPLLPGFATPVSAFFELT